MTSTERRAVASLSVLYVLRMLGLFMVLPLLSIYAVDLPGATPAAIGLALGAYGLTQAMLQVPLGWLSDRVGRKRVILGGLVLFAAGSVIAAMAQSIGDIVLGRAMQGAGAIASTVLALVADLTRAEQRTKSMALVGISIGLSFAIALVLGPYVAGLGGLSAVFWLSAGFALLGGIIVVTWVPTPREQDSPAEPAADSAAANFFDSLSTPGLTRLNYGVFVLHFVLMSSFLILPGLLESRAGIDRQVHWQLYLPVLVFSLLGMVPLMSLAERYGRPRSAFSLALVALLLSLGIATVAVQTYVVVLGLWLFFVGFNYQEATLPSRVSKVAPEAGRGSAMGVYSTCQFLGAFCGGAVGGWIIQHWGEGYLVGVSLALLCGWLLAELKLPVPAVASEKAVTEA